MSTTAEIGKKLVDLCNAGKNLEAIDTLYGEEIVSVEAAAMPNMPQTMTGKTAIRGKNQWWLENHEIHSSIAEGPMVNSEKFMVKFKIDVTAKAGPMKGQRMAMEEIGLYTVKDGEIVNEEFFYGGH